MSMTSSRHLPAPVPPRSPTFRRFTWLVSYRKIYTFYHIQLRSENKLRTLNWKIYSIRSKREILTWTGIRMWRSNVRIPVQVQIFLLKFDIVLYWWGDHCCPIHCDLFKIYCAHPNLGISRTWIFRLNFAQRSVFSGLRFFNEPEISDSGPPA